MRKLLFVLLILPIFIFGQKKIIHKNWKLIIGDQFLLLNSLDGELIDNKSDVPIFSIGVAKESGKILMSLRGASIYRYDPSPENRNFASIEVIIDDSKVYAYKGEIAEGSNKNATNVWLEYLGDNHLEVSISYLDLIEKMKKGNTLYIQTTGAQDPYVFSYSLLGFTAAWNKLLSDYYGGQNGGQNDGQNKQPFRRP